MQSIGFIKRLLIIIYDALLLIAMVMVCYGLLYGLSSFLIPHSLHSPIISKIAKVTYLFFVPFVFYGWFWTHGGQTLGMKAWHVFLVNENGKFINWKTAFIRYCSAILSWGCFGLGFTWALIDKRRLTWHDRLTTTQLVQSKPGKR